MTFSIFVYTIFHLWAARRFLLPPLVFKLTFRAALSCMLVDRPFVAVFSALAYFSVLPIQLSLQSLQGYCDHCCLALPERLSFPSGMYYLWCVWCLVYSSAFLWTIWGLIRSRYRAAILPRLLFELGSSAACFIISICVMRLQVGSYYCLAVATLSVLVNQYFWSAHLSLGKIYIKVVLIPPKLQNSFGRPLQLSCLDQCRQWLGLQWLPRFRIIFKFYVASLHLHVYLLPCSQCHHQLESWSHIILEYKEFRHLLYCEKLTSNFSCTKQSKSSIYLLLSGCKHAH